MTTHHLTRAALAAALIASFSHAALAETPADVQVPDGNNVALETVGVGAITYMCEANDDGDMGWVFKAHTPPLTTVKAARSAATTARPLPGSSGWLESHRHPAGNRRQR